MEGSGDESIVEPTKDPLSSGRPTIYVFGDDNGEIQVGANVEMDMGEMVCMLEVARSKLELLGFRLARQAQRQAEVRQSLLKGVR